MDVSVLIPTFNEAALIESVLKRVGDAFHGCEVIVVDGGSSDGTQAVAHAHATVLESFATRGASLNHAARIARGDVLLFLHADTMLPPDANAEIARVLSDPSVVGGAFRFSFDDASTSARVIAAWVNVRSTLFNVFLGDQALFVRKSVFLRAGGFRDWNLMEDLEILHRLRRFGSLRMTRSAIMTSARRHLRDGWLITTARVWFVTWLHFFRVPPRILVALYRRTSSRRR
jgi:rSAM/selenodomain-associated transferase 2